VGEVRDPGRNVPISVAVGTGLVALLYLALNAVFLHVAPLSELQGHLDVGHVAATYIFGADGAQVMSGLICIGLVSSISAMTWIGPRVTMSMGEDCHALRFLAWKNAQGVPSLAILVQTLIVIALLLTASFEKVLTYVQFSLTLCSFLTVLGVIVLRRTQPDLPRPYKTWGYPVTPIVFLIISGWMLFHIFRSSPKESIAGLVTLLVGLGVYLLSPSRPQPQAA
jgi:APA family basic amino acid/polyamine antiporter